MTNTVLNDLSNMLAASVTGTKVHFLRNLDKTYPAIVFSWSNGFANTSYLGTNDLKEGELQVDVYAKDPVTLVELEDKVITEFNGFVGTVGTTRILKSQVTNKFHSIEDDGNFVRTIITISITF